MMKRANKILAVDDNPVNLDIVTEMLGEEYQLKVADSGPSAIRIARKFLPRVILLDVMMPGMDGLETCRQLRHIPGLDRCAIIMVSAKAMPSERSAGICAGANDYITKPFDEVELLNMVRRYTDPLSKEAERSGDDEAVDGEVIAIF